MVASTPGSSGASTPPSRLTREKARAGPKPSLPMSSAATKVRSDQPSGRAARRARSWPKLPRLPFMTMPGAPSPRAWSTLPATAKSP